MREPRRRRSHGGNLHTERLRDRYGPLRYAYGGLSSDVTIGVGIGAAVGLMLTYYFEKRS